MHILLLKYTANRSQAGRFMDGHKAWIKRGFDDGVFVLAGGLEPDLGGSIIAQNTSLADLRRRVESDPFVSQGIVRAEVLEISPARFDERLRFLATQ